jgi:hypothetical protein
MFMMSLRSTCRVVLPLAVAAVAFSGSAAAQGFEPQRAVSISAGASQFDLSGTGTAPMGAIRADLPLARFALVEVGVGVTRPEQQFGATTTLVIPEAQLQFQLPIGPVLPYLGVGSGLAMDFRPDDVGGTRTDWTASAAGGLRWWITPRAGARAELRVRGIDYNGEGFTAAAAEWTGGLMWRF